VAPDVQPVYSGYYIWRGTADEADLAPATLADIFSYFTFFLPKSEQIIGYPIPGYRNDLRPGRRRYNFIWYRVADERVLREMCVDEAGHQHRLSVPTPLIRENLIRRMRSDAEKVMPSQFLDVLRNIKLPFFTPIYDFASPRFAFGQVALVGDAAATARPHMGFGVSKAGADALALAKALENCEDIAGRLARYDAQRSTAAERIMMHGRKLGTFLGVNVRTEEDRIMAEALSDHHGQLDWIGVPNFLATPTAMKSASADLARSKRLKQAGRQ
jgi:2-polyprenyl-6-methoxyphenol hydroxylase-like FAD-dependent oxidoreductase